MNKNLNQLFNIAQKQQRTVIGLMSGTSLDGLDVALCAIQGFGLETTIKLLQFKTVLYTAKFKNEVKSILFQKNIDIEKLCLLNAWIATQHGEMVNACLKNWNLKNDEIDLIASHGQTIYHAPKRLHQQELYANATLQIGDGDHLAVKTGIITVSDFRQKNIASGGEGAPLAIFGDYLLFTKKEENRILLNIGGISNFTYLPANCNFNETICTDTGPGNAMMDAYVQFHFSNKNFDENASMAMQGKINEQLLQALKSHSFFIENIPKTTGLELFNLNYLLKAQTESNTLNLSTFDVLATLNILTASTIIEAINTLKLTQANIYCSGGGIHNILLMKYLQNRLPQFNIQTTHELNINPDAKEAILFALLANECIVGTGKYFGDNHKNMGKISFPD